MLLSSLRVLSSSSSPFLFSPFSRGPVIAFVIFSCAFSSREEGTTVGDARPLPVADLPWHASSTRSSDAALEKGSSLEKKKIFHRCGDRACARYETLFSSLYPSLSLSLSLRIFLFLPPSPTLLLYAFPRWTIASLSVRRFAIFL